MIEFWKPLLTLHFAKRPLLKFADVLDGAELVRLIGVPEAPANVPDNDWLLQVDTQEQLDSLIAGARAVLSHDGSFPDFKEWREKCCI